MRPIALIRLICGAALTAMLALSASSCGGSAPATLDPVAQAAGVTSHLGGAHLSISGQIGGAGLDVLPWEPLPDGHPLWEMENVIITPHAAGGSPLRLGRSVDVFCENLKRDLAGQPLLSVIDKRKGY